VTKRVLIVGSGAREHALAKAIAKTGADVWIAPGNAGTSSVGRNIAIRSGDVDGLVALALREAVDLVVVGPELPLTLGLVDALAAKGVLAFGPTRAAARLEGSKAFMKRFLKRHGIPTAAFEVFDDPAVAEAYIRARACPLVVKADGLAAGKGVVVAGGVDEALEAVRRMMRERVFGDAGKAVVIEDVLPGEEVSFHVVADGSRFVALAPAQDHKRVGDGDRGPNTGGMGAYAPAPLVTPALHARIVETLVAPTLEGLAKEGCAFRGALFAGLMIDGEEPRVLEYNVRFGDPEAAVLVPLYGGDWLALLEGAARGELPAPAGDSGSGMALAVVMAAEGYPTSPRIGDAIEGLDAALEPGAFVLHAGTAQGDGGGVVTSGGRVLTVGGHASTLEGAARIAYRAVSAIHFPGEHHRSDIGHRAMANATAK
jgi:phosphoribosylamine--glycine ligase